MTEEQYWYEDADAEDNPALKARRDEWRRGASPAQRKAVLMAKETLAFLIAHPGATRNDFALAGIKPNFAPLIAHRLAYWVSGNKMGRQRGTTSAKAQWFASGEVKG